MPLTQPQHPIVAELLACMDQHQQEQFQERAGILEYEAGLERSLAEALAMLEVIRLHGWIPRK